MYTRPARLWFPFLTALLAACGSSPTTPNSGGGGGQGGSGGTAAASHGGNDPGSRGGSGASTTLPDGGVTTPDSGSPVGPDGGENNVTPWAPSKACVDRVAALITGHTALTLQQKIGQMSQVDSSALRTNAGAVSSAFLGSILSGGGSDPGVATNTPADWAAMVTTFMSGAAGMTPKLPLLYGIDAVHGNNNVAGAVIFPHNIGLGATRNPTLVQQVARITALEVLGVGINWAFSPVVAAGRDERWGRTYETFSETPDLAAQMGAAMVLGLQNGPLGSSQSVLACAKHFAGDGATQGGVNQGNTVMDEATFRTLAVNQYEPAIDLGVGSIMVSFSSFNGTQMSADQHLLTDILKGELGFQGFLVSDWDAINLLPGTFSQQVASSVNAGLDMIMMSSGKLTPYTNFIRTLTTLVGAGTVPLARVDDAARRILTIKCEMGLFDKPTPVDQTLQSAIGSAEHRAVARDAVRQSLVLLKNDGAVLPLSKSLTQVVVAGSGADTLAKQCGGWTIDWYGLGTGKGGSTTGTTICKAIEGVVGAGKVNYSAAGTGLVTNGATVGVAVIGEAPYAETMGDATNLALSAADITTVTNLKAAGLKVVVVLLSGRPMILDTILPSADAIVAAWLPGTEGAGVADVLFGDYKPTGKLSHSWPKSMAQIPINLGDATYDPLFAFGFGLTYP